MRRRLRLAARVVLAALALCPAARAHGFHLSFGEADFNAETQRLEVALCVVPEDLETALAHRLARPVTLESARAEELAARYVRDVFRVRSADGRPRYPRWVGMEVTLKEAWLYFEVPLPGGLLGTRLTHRALFEASPDQRNQLRLAGPGLRRTLSFGLGRDVLEVTAGGVVPVPRAPEPKPPPPTPRH